VKFEKKSQANMRRERRNEVHYIAQMRGKKGKARFINSYTTHLIIMLDISLCDP
jgi:hypothetical protein